MALVSGPKPVTEEIDIDCSVHLRCWLRDSASKRRAGPQVWIFQDVVLQTERDLPMQGKFLPGKIVVACAFSSLFPRSALVRSNDPIQ
jgi:hypothetical protein